MGRDASEIRRSSAVRWGLALVLSVTILAPPAVASAISAPIHIANTGGEGVFIRPDPNTSRPAIGWMPEGASPDFHCFAWGQSINGVPIWFNVTYNGVTGFYASFYDDSSYHSNEELTAKYGVPLCGAGPAPPPPTAAPPPSSGGAASGVYSIVDADGGVFFRNSPQWGDTSRTVGVGVYTGDRVQVICGSFGDPVGPYANRWWSYVENLSRPSAGRGWVNAHFINDGVAANQPSPGEGSCPIGTTGVAPKGPGSTSNQGLNSVFFSPNGNSDGLGEGLGIAFHELTYGAWTNSGCDPEPAARFVASLGSDGGSLAGWSRGRIGPIYALLSPKVRANVHRVVLFDPGNSSEIEGSCDGKGFVNGLLAGWVSSNEANRLVILAGRATEERKGGKGSRPTFSGLWHYYLAGIWNQPFADRVKICAYEEMDHEEILREFEWIVETPTTYCPTMPWTPAVTEWHP